MAESTAKPQANWALFVPNELVDGDATLKLTFNWLKGYGTIPAPPERRERAPELVLLLFLTFFVPALMVGVMSQFMDWRGVAWIGIIFALVMLVLTYIYDNLWRPRPVPPPKQKDPADLRAWKEARTKSAFWQSFAATNDQAGFTRECSELLAWFAQSQEVRIAGKTGRDDYGVSAFALSPRGRLVAHCPLTFADRPIDRVRDFAGVRTFFLARRGLLFSLKKVSDGTVPVQQFGPRAHLQYFDAIALAEWATVAMHRPKGVAPPPEDAH